MAILPQSAILQQLAQAAQAQQNLAQGNAPAMVGTLAATNGNSGVIQPIFSSVYEGSDTNLYDDLFGIAIGKKAKARVAQRKENRQAKKNIRLERKRAKTENIFSKARSREKLAEQGIVSPTLLSEVGTLAKDIFGKGGGGGGEAPAETYSPTIGQQQAQQQLEAQTGVAVGYYPAEKEPVTALPAEPTNPPKDNKSMIIAGVVLAVFVFILVIFKSKK